jgi:hypothetical protein
MALEMRAAVNGLATGWKSAATIWLRRRHRQRLCDAGAIDSEGRLDTAPSVRSLT